MSLSSIPPEATLHMVLRLRGNNEQEREGYKSRERDLGDRLRDRGDRDLDRDRRDRDRDRGDREGRNSLLADISGSSLKKLNKVNEKRSAHTTTSTSASFESNDMMSSLMSACKKQQQQKKKRKEN